MMKTLTFGLFYASKEVIRDMSEKVKWTKVRVTLVIENVVPESSYGGGKTASVDEVLSELRRLIESGYSRTQDWKVVGVKDLELKEVEIPRAL